MVKFLERIASSWSATNISPTFGHADRLDHVLTKAGLVAIKDQTPAPDGTTVDFQVALVDTVPHLGQLKPANGTRVSEARTRNLTLR